MELVHERKELEDRLASKPANPELAGGGDDDDDNAATATAALHQQVTDLSSGLIIAHMSIYGNNHLS